MADKMIQNFMIMLLLRHYDLEDLLIANYHLSINDHGTVFYYPNPMFPWLGRNICRRIGQRFGGFVIDHHPRIRSSAPERKLRFGNSR